MKCVIFQYDDRGDYLKIAHINRNYAIKNNYDYHFYTKYADIPSYWQKVLITYILLDYYDIVMYIDSDALVHNNSYKIENLFEGKLMVISPDLNTYFNAGVFIVKKSEITKTIFAEWLSYYDESKWYKKDGIYKTSYDWAGVAYEQGSFNNYLYRKYIQHFNILDRRVLQCHNINEIKHNTFIMHFFHSGKAARISSYLKLKK